MEWALTRTLKDLDVATTATHIGDGGTTEYIHTRVGLKINSNVKSVLLCGSKT